MRPAKQAEQAGVGCEKKSLISHILCLTSQKTNPYKKMRTLYLLFERFGAFFLLVLLEVIAFYLVINFNEKQNLILISSANRVVGNAYQRINDVQDYFNLTNVADSLARENAELRTLIRNYELDEALKKDSVRSEELNQAYDYVAAKIINKSVHRRNNSITLNRGYKDGINPHTGVISDKGIVGIVLKVSKHYSQVMPLLHSQAKISAGIKDKGYFGSLVWLGRDPRYMRLMDIPKYVAVEKGDTIQTTGYSTYFPTGLTIGVVDTVWRELSGEFHNVRVELLEEIAEVEYVYVVNNLRKEEQLEIEADTDDE